MYDQKDCIIYLGDCMEEKIISFNQELDAINLVLEKLVTKQNSSVYDKLCLKCNALLNRIIASSNEITTSQERREVIDTLKRLRGYAVKLSNYKEYLIAAINQNIAALEQEQVRQNIKSDEKVLTLDLNSRKDAA